MKPIDIFRKLRDLKKVHGDISVSLVQFKFHLSFKKAQQVLEAFNNSKTIGIFEGLVDGL